MAQIAEEKPQYNYKYQEVLDSTPKKKVKKNYWAECFAAGAACFGMLLSGIHFSWIGPTLPLLLSEDAVIPITSEQVPWISGCLQIGAVPGSVLGSLIADKFGRKKALLFLTIPFLICSILLIFANNVTDLYISRLIGGFSVGACFSIIPMYVGEISSPEIRGVLGISKGLAMNCGVFMQFVLAPFVSIPVNAIVISVVPVIMFILVLGIPESPYYLLMKDQVLEAREALQRLRQTNDINEELKRMEDAQKEDKTENNKFFDLFTVPSNRKALFIICGIMIVQQLGGASAIFTYSQVIFGKAEINISPELCGILLAATSFFITFLTSSIIDRLGRRPICIFSCVGSAVALLTLGVYFYLQETKNPMLSSLSLVPPLVVIIFKFCFGMGVGPIPYLVLAELFPTSVKASAIGFVSVYGSVLGFLGMKLYQVTTDNYGESTSFFGFCCVCIFGAVFTYCFLPETTGRTLEEIQEDLKNSSSAKGSKV